jgi:hypothetical protein
LASVLLIKYSAPSTLYSHLSLRIWKTDFRIEFPTAVKAHFFFASSCCRLMISCVIKCVFCPCCRPGNFCQY